MIDLHGYWSNQVRRISSIGRSESLSRTDQLVHEVHYDLDPNYKQLVVRVLSERMKQDG
jgi:hypothetical protein